MKPFVRIALVVALVAAAAVMSTTTTITADAANCSSSPYAPHAAATTPTVSDIDGIRSDAAWILSAQRPDGAIAVAPDGVVRPYIANYAAIGLAAATSVTNDPSYADAAWRWIAWYAQHQRRNGYITDYDIENGDLVSTGDMDSTDAYAGTFLLAVRAAWVATNDGQRLRASMAAVHRAVTAITSTRDHDGLTWAKPKMHVKYLMDASETYAGLRAASVLARAARQSTFAVQTRCEAHGVRAGVASLWRAAGSYDWAKHSGGVRQRTEWTNLYPDSLEQLWAVAFGLCAPPRAAALVERFAQNQAQWDEPSAFAHSSTGTSYVGYWPLGAWAFARAGRGDRAHDAVQRIRDASVAADRAWPFTTMNAGQLIVAASGALDRLVP